MDHISIWMEEDLWIHRKMLLGYILTLTWRAKLIQLPIFHWSLTIRENLLKAEKAETQDDWAKVCIYRVPKALRDVNPHAFDPQTVSIGPYHRSKEGLRDMDIHKWRCFRRIIGRSKLDEVFFFNSIREVVSEARRCYKETIQLSVDEFVETMVLDGCFLLEIFLGCFYGFERLGYSPCDPVFSFGRAQDFIIQDVKRLENQVPLFILGRLLGLVTNEMKDKKDQVIRLALHYFGVRTPYFDPLTIKYRKCLHCLDIYRQFLLDEITPFPFPIPKTPIPQPIIHNKEVASSSFKKLLHLITPPNYRNTTTTAAAAAAAAAATLHPPKHSTTPCVTKLREAGIKLRKRETNSSGCFLDIKFESGVLYIPRLFLEDNTRRELHNLIAFEQCHLGCSNHFTSYAFFMDYLIDSSVDVAYLHDCGIIDPFGGGSYSETAAFFNKIAKEVGFDPLASYLSGVTKELSIKVNKYHDSKTKNWMIKIRRMFFNNPWSIVSLVAAIVLLVLTFLQTFYGMYGYYRPRS